MRSEGVKWAAFLLGRKVGKAVLLLGCRNYLPGQFIRIRLKTEQNCRLFMDTFSSAIMNDLSMTFIARLKVDAKYFYQQ